MDPRHLDSKALAVEYSIRGIMPNASAPELLRSRLREEEASVCGIPTAIHPDTTINREVQTCRDRLGNLEHQLARPSRTQTLTACVEFSPICYILRPGPVVRYYPIPVFPRQQPYSRI